MCLGAQGKRSQDLFLGDEIIVAYFDNLRSRAKNTGIDLDGKTTTHLSSRTQENTKYALRSLIAKLGLTDSDHVISDLRAEIERDIEAKRKLERKLSALANEQPLTVACALRAVLRVTPTVLNGSPRLPFPHQQQPEERPSSGLTHSRPYLTSTLNQMVERMNNTVRDREKTFRGMDNDKSAQIMADGMRINYNFIRPHIGLDGKTPAQVAGLDLGLEGIRWKALIEDASRNGRPK